MTDKNKKLYSTRDIYLASVLISLNFSLIGIDYQIEGERNKPVGYFQFDKNQKLNDAVMNYWQGNLTVEPKGFITIMRGLKAEISNIYKNPHMND